MATTVFTPVEEYLKSSYHPDCDYVDGELQERYLGEEWHSSVQSMLASIFKVHRLEWGMRSYTEQRVHVTSTRFRVPDVCVVSSSQPMQGILQTAPLLCVEVLSPEDRFSNILDRVREYIRMGVPSVWIIDPVTRDIWTVTNEGDAVRCNDPVLEIPGTPARIAVQEIFAEIDEAPQE